MKPIQIPVTECFKNAFEFKQLASQEKLREKYGYGELEEAAEKFAHYLFRATEITFFEALTDKLNEIQSILNVKG